MKILMVLASHESFEFARGGKRRLVSINTGAGSLAAGGVGNGLMANS